jgi:5'-nucleotidase
MVRRAAARALLLLTALAASAEVASHADEPPFAAAAPPRAVEEGGVWPPPAAAVTWARSGALRGPTVRIKLLGFNDFHGHLEAPVRPGARPAGGAAVLAAYLKAAERGHEGHVLILHAGDQVGASPPISRLLADEPAMEVLNLLAGPDCRYGVATHFFSGAARAGRNSCNVVGTLGNHEFDRGPEELLRLLEGGTAAAGPYLARPYRGVRVPYVCANVFDRRTGRTLLPPYTVIRVGGISIGVIGAVVRSTPTLVQAWAVASLEFRDEADAINLAAAELRRFGVHTIVVLVHQGVIPVGGGATRAAGDATPQWRGLLAGIVARLDPGVDVVISGHTHSFTNALLPNASGDTVLVTQAYSYGLAYADIDLDIEVRSGRVLRKSAIIVPTWSDAGPGLEPEPQVRALTAAAARAVAPRIAQVVGAAAEPITRRIDASGESALGDLVADAERAAGHGELALVNAGGMRTDLDRGPVTMGEILTLHPFGNRLITTELTGAEIRATLEEQWREDPAAIPQMLKISGLSYRWDLALPFGHHVVAICDGEGRPLELTRRYRVTINDFLAAGGDGFNSLKAAPAGSVGPTDAEALADYLARAGAPIEQHIEGRIARVDRPEGAQCAASAALPSAAPR